jgi:hypothetical protein
MNVMEMEQVQQPAMRPGPIVGGVLLLVLGGGMLLDTTGIADIRMGRLIAPLVLISIGVSSLLSDSIANGEDERQGRRRRRRRDSFGGLWLVGIGAWMLASQTHLFGLTFGTSWPLLVILTGIMIVIRGIR